MFLENVKAYLTTIEEILLMLGCIACLALFIAQIVHKKFRELIRPEPNVDIIRALAASSGSVTGTVNDSQGAVVTGANVTLNDILTDERQTATTNDSGHYDFPSVNPGLYDITISKAGFKASSVRRQRVVVGLVLPVNITLELG